MALVWRESINGACGGVGEVKLGVSAARRRTVFSLGDSRVWCLGMTGSSAVGRVALNLKISGEKAVTSSYSLNGSAFN